MPRAASSYRAVRIVLTIVGTLSLASCGPDPAAEALARGDAALNQMQFAEAGEHYTEAIRQDSTLAPAFLKRGQVRWMGRDFEAAIDDLDRALALDSSLGWASFFRGASLFALDSLDSGVADLARAAASDDLPAEDRARAHRMRGIVFMQADRYDAGTAALGEAIALQPDHPFHYYERGLLHAAAGRAEAAVEDLERFLRMDTTDSDAASHARRTLDTLRTSAPVAPVTSG